ncbi:MAG: KEOPS complex kinase/ATPase Bud32 [Candidatus Hodarchaeota archaeon]
MILEQGELIAKGAEAIIYEGSFLDIPIILKQRIKKNYRLPKIDEEIRKQRLRAEARVMILAWKKCVNVPVLLGIDVINQTLIIEKIQGDLLFSLLESIPYSELREIFQSLGKQVAVLHKNDIIHGDLTVFNIIVNQEKKAWLIDFGLGNISLEIEKQADDLLSFFNTLKAITPKFKELFNDFKNGYVQIYEQGKKIFEHVKKIQSRARYIAREDRIE